ncbi:oxidoreductase [Algimonas arctica]|uniref:Probable oxidoreductase n=1 Tax=Algimonas arctica TaxID=1479486 RepID=A0A8J3CSW3_9PROT|nr:SDR family NAD(P)-dependent oxidoreductase [Algimonas arctica]GHA94661.1 oxidoreductase [Algimonas arctica]
MSDRSGFGHQTTADEVLDGIDLSGRLVLITGGASGLGHETARAMAAKGAQIIIAARDMEKGEAAMTAIHGSVPDAQIEVMQLDLADLDSIRAFTTLFLREHPRLDLLINNAGVMACAQATTKDGFEMQFGTNHLGHFLLTNRLRPALEASAKEGRKPRVVTLSSRAHHTAPVDLDDPNYKQATYEKWEAYGRSKSANALFALELDKRGRDTGLRSYAVHPGGIMTNLGRHLTDEDIAMLMARFSQSDDQPGFKTIPQGAATSCYAATAPELADIGGMYLEDCGQTFVNDDLKGDKAGQRSWIMDADVASKLWTLSEELVSEQFA